MSLERIRALCLSFPGVTEDIKWENNLVFSVGGRMFTLIDLEPPYRFSFKCSDEDYAELMERDGIIPAPYLARAMWVAVESLDDVLEGPEIDLYLRRAHAAVMARLPKRTREALVAPRARSGRTAPRRTGRSKRR